ncbi:hypothetical protein OsJ_27521 [Oryza sativa Japonica Group]|uniref:Uncharacterized protein n=1 Tax=Oryza sativa subsp. japonica TaxID=39947 RepID=A3BTP3_ORYSJ|nr:hypothetical protein OsJ_27521 [Oryza sativa Japonica Group]
MASSSSTIASSPALSQPVTEKLARGNFSLWRAQVLATLRGAQMAGFVDGTKEMPAPTKIVKKDEKDIVVPNPDYTEWVAQEQQVLSYLLLSLSREILSQVVHMNTAAGVWTAIEGMFTSQSRARAINTRMALATTQKGNLSVINYVNKMRGLADEMTATGKKLDD